MYLQCNIYKGTHTHIYILNKKNAHSHILLSVSIFHAKNIKGPSELFTQYCEALSGAAQFNHSTPLLYKVFFFFTYLEKNYSSSIVIPLDRMDLCQVLHNTKDHV